jgi:hypothetical protein
MLNLLLTTTNAAVHSEFYLVLFNAVYSLGALAAGIVGVIAWYNSKRPVGWEDRARPSFIPVINIQSSEEA